MEIVNEPQLMELIERIVRRDNLTRAMRAVQRNKGSAGIDRMPVCKLDELMSIDYARLVERVISGKYLPQAILGVAIQKPNGGERILGIPTVTDRLLQQAVLQIIAPRFEYEFSDYSYGFRPNKNALQAVLKAQSYIEEGYRDIVDIDLKSFFDNVSHKYLMQLVYRKVKCKKTLRLIRKWLRSPMWIDGKLIKRRKGIPQGSPLSPLLSNILLHELDRELEKRGLKFVRYADDFSIYAKSKSEAKQVGNQIYLFLKHKLRLPINREKSGIRRPQTFTILGFGFVSSFQKGDKGKYQLVVSEKSWKKLKQEIKTITRKTSPISFSERIRKLNQLQRGWLNYFRGANIYMKLKKLDSWIRRRLRACIWHDWKKPERRRKNLIRLGVKPGIAYAYSRTRKKTWAVAGSPILITTVTLKRLKRRGYQSMTDLYNKISPLRNEPPYTRPVRTVV